MVIILACPTFGGNTDYKGRWVLKDGLYKVPMPHGSLVAVTAAGPTAYKLVTLTEPQLKAIPEEPDVADVLSKRLAS